MPLLLQDAVGSIIRWALQGLFGYLVYKGIWTPAQSSTFVEAATGSLLVLLWMLWTKRDRMRVLLTALASKQPMSLETAKIVAKVQAPALSTPKNEVPTLEAH